MSKYRKKPVVIEAIRFTGIDSYLEIVDFAKRNGNTDADAFEFRGGKTPIMLIPTLEGIMTASPGDFIIRGVNGEFYPCKPDIFEQTYEPFTGKIDWTSIKRERLTHRTTAGVAVKISPKRMTKRQMLAALMEKYQQCAERLADFEDAEESGRWIMTADFEKMWEERGAKTIEFPKWQGFSNQCSDWNNVKDDPPDYETYVWICQENGVVSIAYMEECSGHWYGGDLTRKYDPLGEGKLADPVWWKPIQEPEPPMAEKEDSNE